jgi:hypothetical protein
VLDLRDRLGRAPRLHVPTEDAARGLSAACAALSSGAA